MDGQTNGVAKHCRNEPHIEPTQRLVVETIRLKFHYAQQPQTAPDTGMLPPTILYVLQPNIIWSIAQHLIIVEGRHCFPLGPSMYYPFYIDIRF